MAIVLSGGSSLHRTEMSGVAVRSEPHLLMVGDPGMGKSQLLRFASKIVPRSVFTTGIGSTSAGLTVTAVMENGEWHLEAGALVLSDGGICCIDEFNSMKEHDRASIHEAMEQQTISVAKASMVCKLNTRCSILAATNPIGPLDPNRSMSLNIAMASPLLSRFDLVLLLRDTFDPNLDETISDHVLISRTKNDPNIWNPELLSAYFSIVKGIHPVLTDDANSILSSYYQAQRQAPDRNVARTTVRLLDSLVRLSQGHARFMFHSEVLVMDAVMAVALIESSMQGSAILLPTDIEKQHATFPSQPMNDYKKLMSTILQKLHLYDLLNSELGRLRNDTVLTPDNSCLQSPQGNSTFKDEIRNPLSKNDIGTTSNDVATVSKNDTVDPTERQTCSNVNKDIVFRKPLENVKRKRVSDKTEKRSKKSKNEMNDAELINLIPSVNDLFEDELGLDVSFMDNVVTELSTQEKTENLNKNKNELKKFQFKQKKTFPVDSFGKENEVASEKVPKTVETFDKVAPKVTPEKKVIKESLGFLQQFAFKKTPKKEEAPKKETYPGETEKSPVSRVSAKNLFQSQDDDDIDFTL